MAIHFDLPPELEAAARKEAERRCIPVEQLFIQGMIAQLPDDACPAVIRNLFQQWYTEWKAALAANPPSEVEEQLDEQVRSVSAARRDRMPLSSELRGAPW